MPKKVKLAIWDKRMFELMDFVIKHNIHGIKNNLKFYKAVGIPNWSTVYQVQAGKQSFRHAHFYKASKLFNVSMEWFYGFADNMYRKDDKNETENLLLQALFRLQNKRKR